MENHHLSAAFALLRDPSYNFLEDMPAKSKASFRKQVIDAVMATDMKQHFSMVRLINIKFAVVSSPGTPTFVLHFALHTSPRSASSTPSSQWLHPLAGAAGQDGESTAVPPAPERPVKVEVRWHKAEGSAQLAG